MGGLREKLGLRRGKFNPVKRILRCLDYVMFGRKGSMKSGVGTHSFHRNVVIIPITSSSANSTTLSAVVKDGGGCIL